MKKYLLIIPAILVVVIAIGLYSYYKSDDINLKFKENNAYLLNPERGIYVQNFCNDEELFEYYYTEKDFRVVLLAYDMSGFNNEEYLPDEKLKELDDALQAATDVGMGIVFRAAYDFVGDYTDPDDFQYILNHVEQIDNILNKYQNTIMAVQAGYIGPYGEWHSSRYNENDENGNSYKEMLLKKMLDTLSEDIPINLRRPVFIREAVSSGLPITRFGYHDDGLLSSNTDYGTYSDPEYSREDELNWLAENITTPMNGGETICISEFTDIKNAVSEFDKMQITYLNGYCNADVIDYWKSQTYNGQNGYDYLVNHLGYRLSLDNVSLNVEAGQFQNLKISGVIRNTGFAKPNEDYEGYLVIKSEKDTIYVKLDQDFSQKDKLLFQVTNILPDEFFKFEDGAKIQIGILITDRLKETPDEKYCIQFANDEVNYADGVNYFTEYKYNAKGQKYELIK